MKILLALFVIAWFVMGIILIAGALVHEFFVRNDNQVEEK